MWKQFGMAHKLTYPYATLAKKNILIPSSIATSKRGFSKQNAIKSHLRNKLNLKALDALM